MTSAVQVRDVPHPINKKSPGSGKKIKVLQITHRHWSRGWPPSAQPLSGSPLSRRREGSRRSRAQFRAEVATRYSPWKTSSKVTISYDCQDALIRYVQSKHGRCFQNGKLAAVLSKLDLANDILLKIFKGDCLRGLNAFLQGGKNDIFLAEH